MASESSDSEDDDDDDDNAQLHARRTHSPPVVSAYRDPVAMEVATMAPAQRQRCLYAACRLNDHRMVQQLLAVGADPTLRDFVTGATPLQVCTESAANECEELVANAIEDLPVNTSSRSVVQRFRSTSSRNDL